MVEESGLHPQKAQNAYIGLMNIVEKEISNSNLRHLVVGIKFELMQGKMRVAYECCAVNPYKKNDFDAVMTKYNTEYSDRAFIVVSNVDESKVEMGMFFHIEEVSYVGEAVIINNQGRAEIHFGKMRVASVNEVAIPVDLGELNDTVDKFEDADKSEMAWTEPKRTLH